MRPLLAAAVSAAVLAATIDPALAGGPPGSTEPTLPDPPPQTRTRHYGTQVFLADLAVIATVGLVAKAESDGGGSGVGSLVSLGYFAAAPLVHMHNGNPSGARKSLAARALMPIGGALVGMALVGAGQDDDDPYEDDLGGGGFAVIAGMLLGTVAGAVGAMVLDWTVLAKKSVEVEPAGFAVAPSVGVGKRSVSVGVTGRF